MTRVLGRAPAFIDGACDGLVFAFAGWTLFYQMALVGQFSMLVAGWPWLLATIGLSTFCGVREARDGSATVAGGSAIAPTLNNAVNQRVIVLLLLCCGAAVWGRELWGIWPAALLVIAAVLIQVLPAARSWHHLPSEITEPARQSLPSHLLALAISAGLAVLTLFLLRPDADDTFYVNRATWVATHGTAAVNDTMFGPNVMLPAYSGGVPTYSVESLQGVLAHTLGLQAPTFCYLVAGPALGALLGWTTWRLVREWARRRAALAMVVAVVFVVASADSIVGNYSLGRIWQGKAIACAILLPFVWMLLTRMLRQASRRDFALLLAAGVAFVGLTTTSALLAPVVAGAALVAAVLLRSPRLALGAMLFAAGPVIAGLVQAFSPAAIGGGGDNAVVPAIGAFAILFGPALPMILLGVAALALAPRLVPGPAGVLIGCGTIASMAALLPGVFEVADALTGAGAVAWRLVIAMPMGVLVSMLVTLPTARVWRPAAGTLIVVALVVPMVWGTWLWEANDAQLTKRPTWKVDQSALADVRAARELDVGEGLWLLPPKQMEILALSTVDVVAVIPRFYYLPTLQAPPQAVQDRERLARLESGQPVTVDEVRLALKRLDVSIACVDAEDQHARMILRRAVGVNLGPVAGMRCHVFDA